MKIPSRTFAFLFLIAALGACHRAPENPSSSQAKGPLPDQTMQHFTLSSYSKGQLEWALTAPHADIFESENRVEMVEPFIQFYKGEQKSTTLQSVRGRVNTESKDMWAWDNVVMTSTDGARLNSDWMQYVHALNLIQSTAPVTIVRGGSVTNGVGWEAKPDLSQVVIHQQKVEIAPEDVKRGAAGSKK